VQNGGGCASLERAPIDDMKAVAFQFLVGTAFLLQSLANARGVRYGLLGS
jgi:hypothetical protein